MLPKQALYQAELYSDGGGAIAAFLWTRNAGKYKAMRVARTGKRPRQGGAEGAETASKHGQNRQLLSSRELHNSPPSPCTGASPSGKAAVFGTAIPGFESLRPSQGELVSGLKAVEARNLAQLFGT